ncbi:metallophosphatase [Chamaesiphon sp.]|uniref:metallophosphatase n=1 Tax=Chamaesiphon sp. TaxID=2814140 RepID=UPI003593FAEB
MWAIASGIEGNLAAYEAVVADLRKSRQEVENFYLIGDIIGPKVESNRLVKRIQQPRQGEPTPLVCQGWWEEQILILHALGRTGEPTELIDRYGIDMTKTLWDAIDPNTLEWVSSLEFGFVELDCFLIHGSSLSVSDELTPTIDPIQAIDRLSRMDANQLFCGRSGLAFEYKIESGSLNSQVQTLDKLTDSIPTVLSPRRIIGVGSVGRIEGKASYTLYHPGSNKLEFKTVRYGAKKGFG